MRTARCALIVLVAVVCWGTAAHASGTTDMRCRELLNALMVGDYSKATSHFDDTMKAGLPPSKLAEVWQQNMLAPNGKLLSWDLSPAEGKGIQEVVIAPLKFERSSGWAAEIAINSETNEITGLHFIQIAHQESPATTSPYANPQTFHSENVTVGAAGFDLPGILSIPSASGGPWPAVLMVGGSGPTDMDETTGPNHPFKDIAEGLSSRNIVVLRYSKRTKAFPQRFDRQTVTVKEEYLDDAIEAVNFLRRRREVATDRIFIAGHSLGATIAPEIALKSRPIQGLILLAPTGRKLTQMIVQQTRFLGEASPSQLAELERKANELDSHKMPRNENFLFAPASYFYDLDSRDEVAIARKLDVPILILHGGRDYQVIDEDIRHWQDGLKGMPHVRVETFPALNHLFIAGTGEPRKGEYETPGHVDKEVIDAMSTFIQNPLGQ